MNPEVRPVDARRLLIRAKHDIEALLKRKEETVKVDLATISMFDSNSNHDVIWLEWLC